MEQGREVASLRAPAMRPFGVFDAAFSAHLPAVATADGDGYPFQARSLGRLRSWT